MEEKRNLYIMISKTHTGIGKIIRKFSHYTYNHVSLTLDPSFRTWVSFARYVHNVPLYGGFIMEPVERYLADDKPDGEKVQVRIFRVEISSERYESLSKLFSKAGNRECGLVYNLFDITAATIGRKIPVSDAYTCLGFARAILGKDYTNIKELDEDMQSYLIYEGNLSELASDSGDRTDQYFSKLDFMEGTKHTVKQFATLTSRAIRRNRPDTVAKQVQ